MKNLLYFQNAKQIHIERNKNRHTYSKYNCFIYLVNKLNLYKNNIVFNI